MNILILIVSAVICYLFGSISSSILVGRMFGMSDIRKHGSGNAGATNTLRVLGKKAAIFTVLGDVLKTVIAVLIAKLLSKLFLEGYIAQLSVYISCFAIALGHNFPIYFKFKGGKGVLTSGVIIIMMSPLIGSVTVLTCLTVMAITKYVSLGSVMAALLYPVILHRINTITVEWYKANGIMWGSDVIFAFLMAMMVVFMHRSNIKRLMNHTESKLSIGKKKENSENENK